MIKILSHHQIAFWYYRIGDSMIILFFYNVLLVILEAMGVKISIGLPVYNGEIKLKDAQHHTHAGR